MTSESLRGRTLSHYQIQEELGRGGMGEVYLAYDSQLGRKVALKVLPAEVAENAERIRRFEREARSVAALNHPNIVTVHSVEASEGVHFFTMELVEGQTLAERIRRGALPLETFFELAIPLADAVSTAHGHGVTHRDLKPANLMVTSDGRLKVLDFGLAKVQHLATEAVGSELPTQSMTQERAIVGTVSYMSPEQAEGKPVDPRTDIFALGIIFYEMLTGRHPFLGESYAATLSAVLKDTPPPVTDVNPNVPHALGRIVKRCLAKDLTRRYQSSLDLRNDLEELREELASSPVGAPAVMPAPRARSSRARLAALAVGVGVVLLLASWRLVRPHFLRAPAEPRITRFHIGPPEGGSFGSNPAEPHLAVSPDGRFLAFEATTESSTGTIWLRALDSVVARPLSGSEGGRGMFWSPDGSSMAFTSEGKLQRISLAGGPPQTLADGIGFRGAWSEQGDILVRGGDGIYRVSSSGGEAVPVIRPDPSRGEISYRYPQFLPDGRQFLYLVIAEEPENRGVYSASLDSTERKRILPETSNVAYAPPGYLFFVRENALLAVAFDASRLQITGEPSMIADRVMPGPTGRFAPFSVSEDVLAYRQGGFSFETELVWIDREGRELGTVGTPGLSLDPSFSPDETRLAFSRWDDNTDVWTIDLARNVSQRFTSHPDIDWSPVWSPDGQDIAFRSSRIGTWGVFRKLSDGTSSEELAGRIVTRPHDWSADGRLLLIEASNDLWVLPMSGDEEPYAFLQTDFVERQPRLSPDGRWLAYTSDDSGASELYVQEFREGGRRWRVSTQGGFDPRWRPDGRELFYLEPGAPTGTSHVAEPTLMAVTVETGEVFQAGAPQALFQVRVSRQWMENVWTYDVASGGERFLFSKVTAVEPSLITVVLNWREALVR